jgi:outer membrane immunogenic protein
MRKVLIALAATAAAFASPAMANEGRIEARGGVVWDGGASEDVWGVAAGYDWDLGDKAFGGLEVSGDKIGASGSGLGLGATARLGLKAGEKTKFFVDAGYTVNTCAACEDAVHAGAGVEVGFGKSVYGKLGYRHFFVANGFSDYDAVVAGVGVRF